MFFTTFFATYNLQISGVFTASSCSAELKISLLSHELASEAPRGCVHDGAGTVYA